jgi:hypothetical protein
MPGSKQLYTDEELREVSRHLVYHVRMYVETLLWLQGRLRPAGWDTEWNAMLEDHLVHARLLSEFLVARKRKRDDDVIALDFFHDQRADWKLPLDNFLRSERDDIGGHLMHITVKGDPLLKSERGWGVGLIANALVPLIREFFDHVPQSRLAEGIRSECVHHLAKLTFQDIPVFIYSAA